MKRDGRWRWPVTLAVIVAAVALSTCSTEFKTDACGEGLTDCSGECVDLETDRDNCGSCGGACSTGERCSGGTCVEECPSGTTDCEGECVDLDTDRDNCGSCGNACPSGRMCADGTCVDECPPGTTDCEGECVDLDTDRDNCGSCGNACPTGQMCAEGTCVSDCPDGTTECGGSCVDLETSEDHCGRCDNACATGGYCDGGTCRCPGSEEDCGGTCIDTLSHHDHCGSCFDACSDGEVCAGGTCETDCPDGTTDCSGSCVDLTSSDDHCGACDNACPTDFECVGSTCVCRGGLTDCSGECVDLTSDDDHCGSCTRTCGDDRHCASSACVCNGSLTECSGACVDLSSDPANCGGCGSTCGTGMVCSSGTCRCGSGLIACSDGTCDSDSDGDGVCNREDACPGLDDSVIAILQNPNFTATGGWTTTGGASVATSRPGYADTGVGYWSPSAVCAMGSISQDLCIPGTFGSTGARALEFTARALDCSDGWPCYGKLFLYFDGYERQAGDGYFGPSWSTKTVCLGEAAYGGVITLKLTADPYTSPCTLTSIYELEIDNAGVFGVSDGSCPAPGTVLNGNFSSGMFGWVPEATGTADVVVYGGSNQGHLRGAASTCESPRLEGKISIPLRSTTPHTALEYTVTGTSGKPLYVKILYGSIAQVVTVTGTGSTESYVTCIDTLNQGHVLGLEFESPHPGSCTSSTLREFWIDNITVGSDATVCPP